MNILWEKNVDCRGERFVDLFDDFRRSDWKSKWNREIKLYEKKHDSFVTALNKGKSDFAWITFNMAGKSFIYRRNWIVAIQRFSQSLCYAPKDTNLSRTYMNRAYCFLKLGEYAKCLKDIELAKKAKYPFILRPLLLQVEVECKSRMQLYPAPAPYEPELCSDASELFPAMADVVEIQSNAQYGRHIVAKADIDVGQTIMIEEHFVDIAVDESFVHCFQCMRTMQNFIPCKGCSDAIFCSDECKKSCEIHKISCRASVHRMPRDITITARSILQVLHLFANADAMMEFVAKTLSERDTESTAKSTDELSRYKIFLSLQPAPFYMHLVERIYIIYTALMQVSYVRRMFHMKKHKRFLMHLVGQHFLNIQNNSFGGETISARYFGLTGLLLSFFNHSCAANVFNSSIGNKEICITMRPIKKGEQLFIKYVFRGDYNDRQTKLQYSWNFRCACEKCIPIQRCEDMETVERFMEIGELAATRNYNTELENKCVEFLKTYGALPWTYEMEQVLSVYTKCLLSKFPTL